MRTMLFAVGLMVAVATPGAAQTYESVGGYPACLTEALFDEATMALVNRDAAHFQALKGCIITKPGLRAAVIDRGFAMSKVRFLLDDGTSVVMYTNRENLRQR